MNRADIEQQVLEEVAFLLKEQSGETHEPALTDNVKEIGLDSLDVVELLMSVEEEYDVSIPDEKVAECDTLNDVVDLVIAIVSE